MALSGWAEELCEPYTWGPIEDGVFTQCFTQVVLISIIPLATLLVIGTWALVSHLAWRRKNISPGYAVIYDEDDSVADSDDQEATSDGTSNAWTLATLVTIVVLELLLVVGQIVMEARGTSHGLPIFTYLAAGSAFIQWAYLLGIISYLTHSKRVPGQPPLQTSYEKSKRHSIFLVLLCVAVYLMCKGIELYGVSHQYRQESTSRTDLILVALQFGLAVVLATGGVITARNLTNKPSLEDIFLPQANGLPKSLEVGAGLWSQGIFGWINPLIELGFTKTLDLEDVPDLHSEDKAAYLCAEFAWFRRIGMRVRAVLISEVYSKALKRRGAAPEEGDNSNASTGQVTNLMAVDTQKILDISCYLPWFWVHPIEIVVCTGLLVLVLGWPALAGIAVMVAVLPTGGYVGKLIFDKQRSLIVATDARISAMTEALQGIRVIKFFAWEQHYFKKLTGFRNRELVRLKTYLYMKAGSRLIWFAAPILVSFVTFFTYTHLAKRELSAEIAFTGLALFNALRDPLRNLPDMIVRLTDAKVSMGRLEAFLAEDELERYLHDDSTKSGTLPTPQPTPDATDVPVGFKGPAAFSWVTNDARAKGAKGFALTRLEVKFPPGGLSLVIGTTACGKTSLLGAMLGEMNRIQGQAVLPDSRHAKVDPATGLSSGVAYAAQQAWLMNATIKDNILFGLPYEEARYQRVIFACALEQDLAILEGGDMTEIGEKGVNVSGGQKARISLARAAYSTAGYILLDDPLSAVDAPTAHHLFQHCIMDLLRGRTRILVTHAVALCVPQADFVVVMKRGGVASQGPPSAVVGKGPGKIDLETVLEESDAESDSDEDLSERSGKARSSEHTGEQHNEDDFLSKPTAAKNPGLRLTEDEARARGSVKGDIYWFYIKSAGGFLFALGLGLSYAAVQLFTIGQDWWLKQWSQAYTQLDGRTEEVLPSNDDRIGSSRKHGEAVNVDRYLMIYALIGLVSMLAVIVRIFLVYSGSLQASRKLHQDILLRLLQAPMRFFDTTPMGRIVNRFSRDLQTIDQDVSQFGGEFLANMVSAIAVIILIACVTPLFLPALVPISLLYMSVARRYLRTSTELKRLDSITRSPIYSHFSETINGASTIRAYGADARFLEESNTRVDANHRAFFYLWVSNRWLGVRVDFVGYGVSFCASLAILASMYFGGGMDPGAAGLSLSYALTFQDALLWVVRMHAFMEMSFNSVERVHEYLGVEQEKPAEVPATRPPSSWPAQGRIEFKNVTARYAPELVPVLRDVSFAARAGEKVGIVGRTGAGKSTIIQTLFRFLELEGAGGGGQIFIDGLDIATLGLRSLRSELTVIPQDPVLFHGTVRFNLDPFGEHTDLACWTALRRAHLLDDPPTPHSPAVVATPMSIGGGASSNASAAGSMSTSLVHDRTGSLVSRSIPSTPPSSLSRRTSTTSASGKKRVHSRTGSVSGKGGASFKPPAPLRRSSTSASHLMPAIRSITPDTIVAEGGQNFSQGQRQLLCLARALLGQNRIIILDECTAAVDVETDARIQHTIRTEFRGSTLLCVAHRLRTVSDYDKILVLSHGEVAEFGSPTELLGKTDGPFRSLANDSGDLSVLVEIARAADEARLANRKR
ncbi:hypothetical protein HKX48_004894 [Thoreauomyces humboldtii]|nr:hypothetical protein HKX48_004894 [Thoreauomyces humboldtii]